MHGEKRNIFIVRHPSSARLNQHGSLFCDSRDFSNHGTALVQKLTKRLFLFAITKKHCSSHMETRNPRVALKS